MGLGARRLGGLGKIEIDAVRAQGFNVPFAAAVTISSATIGPIFPPSIPLIIYGSVTGASVLQLLLGGIVQGLLCTAMLDVDRGFARQAAQLARAARWPTARELWTTIFWPASAGDRRAGDPDRGHAHQVLHAQPRSAAVTVAYAVLMSSLFYRD